MLFPTLNIVTEELEDDLFLQKQVKLSVLRLDKIHPVVSGNKLFKLHYFLKNAIEQSAEGIVTFGGAYSNHLVATAYACKENNLKSIGVVRGEAPSSLSHTLRACFKYGMALKFISRADYDKKESLLFKQTNKEYNNYQVVPEGGYGIMGAMGASLITDLVKEDASHICCAVGTATTLSGLLKSVKNNCQVIGIPVIKNMEDLQQRIEFLTGQSFSTCQLKVMNAYHFGGYAKRTQELTDFMNSLYDKHRLPTDFVYTGKMMFAVIDSIKKNFFPKGSNVVCIHTGGLQGNLSLPQGSLVF